MKIALHNLGCKVNAYETDAIREMLEGVGHVIVPFKGMADIYIVNTCTVTNIADRKSRQMLHRAKKYNPDGLVIAMGCYVQAQEKQAQEKQTHKEQTQKQHYEQQDDNIDIIIGNNKKQELLSVIKSYDEQQEKNIAVVVDIAKEKGYEDLSLSTIKEHTRAYIKVQDGCNQFCSYCIIPHVRGRVRSRAKSEVIQEITALVNAGCKEVILTGIHLSSYGTDFETKETLLSLIKEVAKIKGLQRIRLGSLEPRIVDEEFVKALKDIEQFCPHFHLSLQSGCDETLKRMNRRYDSAEYREKCKLLRKYFENPAITTDVIVGFPAETQEEFESTHQFLQEVKLYETHIFKYSKREGTPAATMKEQVREEVKQERSQILLALAEKNKQVFEQQFTGRVVEVLVEEKVLRDGEEWWVGHTKEYIKVALKSKEDIKNQILRVEMNNHLQIVH